jgi:hypothetical protein
MNVVLAGRVDRQARHHQAEKITEARHRNPSWSKPLSVS